MVRYLKVYLFTLLFACVPLLFSNDTGSASYRAAEFYLRGDYIKANNYFIRALSAARKEANLEKENKILLNLTALEIHSLRFSQANTLLKKIHFEALKPDADYYNLIAIQVYHGLGQCLDSPMVKDIYADDNSEDQLLIARSKLQLAECYIDSKEFNKARNLIKGAEDVLEESGQFAFALGQLAFAQKNFDAALSYFTDALIKAQKKQRFFHIGVLLYHLGLTAEANNSVEEAQKLFYRSIQVFEKLKLKNWFNKVSEHIEQ